MSFSVSLTCLQHGSSATTGWLAPLQLVKQNNSNNTDFDFLIFLKKMMFGAANAIFFFFKHIRADPYRTHLNH